MAAWAPLRQLPAAAAAAAGPLHPSLLLLAEPQQTASHLLRWQQLLLQWLLLPTLHTVDHHTAAAAAAPPEATPWACARAEMRAHHSLLRRHLLPHSPLARLRPLLPLLLLRGAPHQATREASSFWMRRPLPRVGCAALHEVLACRPGRSACARRPAVCAATQQQAPVKLQKPARCSSSSSSSCRGVPRMKRMGTEQTKQGGGTICGPLPVGSASSAVPRCCCSPSGPPQRHAATAAAVARSGAYPHAVAVDTAGVQLWWHQLLLLLLQSWN